MIAYPDRVLLLDCETAHWGDPAFDVAFMLMHLLLDGSRPGRPHAPLADDAARFWAAYRAAGGRADDERAVVAELGCLLLARVCGKSPLPTLTDAAHRAARRAARHHAAARRDARRRRRRGARART